MRKEGGFRQVSDYRAVNEQLEKVMSVMLNLEAEEVKLPRAACFESKMCCRDTGRYRWQFMSKRFQDHDPWRSFHVYVGATRT